MLQLKGRKCNRDGCAMLSSKEERARLHSLADSEEPQS